MLPVVVPSSSAMLVSCLWDQQRTAAISVLSLHPQMVHGEDARTGGRTAYHRMLQEGTARIGEHHSTDESCKGHDASGGQAIPLEGIRLLALLR